MFDFVLRLRYEILYCTLIILIKNYNRLRMLNFYKGKNLKFWFLKNYK